MNQFANRLTVTLVRALFALTSVLPIACSLPSGLPAEDGGAIVEEGLTGLVYETPLVSELRQPLDDRWLLPAAADVVGDTTFILDTGNNRILKLDETGHVLAIFGAGSPDVLALQQPMAMATDGSRLFVANSLSGEVLVLDLAGRVQQALALQPITATDRTPRPIGVAPTADGDVLVSDADNHRVLRLDSEGRVLWSAGTGTRAGSDEGFNVPGALAVDGAGNIYVVDTLNGRVVELSRDGTYVRQFGQLGKTAGTFARPKGVAVDAAGRVFVSDGLLATVQVFAADGTFLGVAGQHDQPSGTPFQAPAGLSLDGNRLLVADRIGGLITLGLPGASVAAPAETVSQATSR